jgi:RNA polymerase sigma-70 factor (ECF subfamily)
MGKRLEVESQADVCARLLMEHQRDLFRFIFSIVHSIPDAEDVLQQTAATIWEKFGDYEPCTNFAAWARSIARYKVLEFARRKNRERLVFSEPLMELLAEQPVAGVHEQQASLDALARCRKKLPQNDQQLLSLCYDGTRTIQDAARAVNRPVGSVYDSLTRIRRALYACVTRTLSSEGN